MSAEDDDRGCFAAAATRKVVRERSRDQKEMVGRGSGEEDRT